MTWTLLHAHLHRTLKERQLVKPGKRLLVAVSGGQDSLCLLKLLVDLQPKWNWHLAVAHCDHRWQPHSANAEFVQTLAHSWNLPYFLEVAETVNKTEAGAREWRYQVLTKLAQQAAFSHIATGHTASDRAETLLYNLVRGSGADGLQALTWQRLLAPGIHLIRPLLDTTRTQTGQFCQEMNLTVWEDSANQDLHYARNRIRRELIPFLKEYFNPQVESTLAQTAELLQADVEFLESSAAKLFSQSRHPDQPGLRRSSLRQSPLAIQRRVARQFLQAELPSAPNFNQIEKLVALISAPNRSQSDPFPGGAIALVDGDWIWLKRLSNGSLKPESSL